MRTDVRRAARWPLALLLALASTPTAAEPTEPWPEIEKLLASDGANGDRFGVSVALSGDTAFVGAYTDEFGPESGAVYMLVRSEGVWIEQAKLVPSDGAANDTFGFSLALSGDTLLIGANRDDDQGMDSGSAYVFVKADGTWTEQAKLLPSDGTFTEYFGSTVALSGDTALVGSRLHSHNGFDDGAAYLFVRSEGSWTEQAELLASDGVDFDWFGSSVALSGDTALIGASQDVENEVESGSVYVFEGSDGIWTEQDKLLPGDPTAEAIFGSRLALAGDTALISATWDDDNGLASGSVYVFERSEGTWTEQDKLLASDGESQDLFGIDLALSGGTALVGASRDGDNGFSAGAAYVFVKSGGVWSERDKLLASDGAAEDSFGLRVALSGETALIGAYQNDEGGLDAGAAYVFSRVLFEDGFESGDTAAWSTTVP